MTCVSRIAVSACALVLPLVAASTKEKAVVPFTPFDKWKTAVAAGDKTELQKLYSTNPPARLTVGKNTPTSVEDEVQFWAGLRPSGMARFNPKVLSLETSSDRAQLVLRVQAQRGSENIVAAAAQLWVHEADGWRIAASQRSDFHADSGRRLPEPVKPNTALYPPPADAQSELNRALAEAGREKKRVLVVFGANWCYDCHVLDTTFHSPAFRPLVQPNYVVVHVNIGDEGKDNNDLAARFGVNLDHGIPSLAVLDPSGRVIVAQHNGEFESTVKIGPEDVKAFLEKWKPART